MTVPSQSSDDVRDAAVDLIRRVWAPVPIPRGQKKPAILRWHQLQLSEADVPQHFAGGENIGVVTGKASGGLVDVDLDCEEAVALAPAFLPATPMRSGRSSRPESHRWYVVDKVPSYLIVKDVDGDGTTLLELRGDGHQTIVPPSVHPDGEAYVWHGPLDPAVVTGRELENAVRRLGAATLLVRHWPRKAGSRHDIANALAGMLLRSGVNEEVARTFVGAVAEAAGDEEAGERAKAAIATSRAMHLKKRTTGAPTLAQFLGRSVVDRLCEVMQIGTASHSEDDWGAVISFNAFELPEFPVRTLPDWLEEFVATEVVATQTPAALPGGLVLTACALGLGGVVRVEIRPGWQEPANIFTVTALDPGNRKSAVFSDVTAPIQEYERAECRRLGPEIRDAESRGRILKLRVRKAEEKASKAKTAEERHELERDASEVVAELNDVDVPATPRLFADDVTPEKLAALLSEHGGRFGVLSPEGGIFEILAGRYDGNNAPNLDVFLKGHAGDALRVDRITRGPDFVPQPALTVGLAVQNDVLRGLSSKPGFRGRGLLARCLWSVPTSLIGRREINTPPVPPRVRENFSRNLTRILALSRATHDRASQAPHVVRFSAEAHDRFTEFERQLEPQLGPSGDLHAPSHLWYTAGHAPIRDPQDGLPDHGPGGDALLWVGSGRPQDHRDHCHPLSDSGGQGRGPDIAGRSISG